MVTHKILPTISGYMDFTSRENPAALPMEFVKRERYQGVRSTFVVPKTMAGWRAPDFVAAHPGAVATALTTAMGRAAMYATRQAARVKSFNVDYIDLVPVDEKVTCEASLVARRGESEVVVEASISNSEGTMLAKGSGVCELFDLAIGGDVHASVAAARCDPAFLASMHEVVK